MDRHAWLVDILEKAEHRVIDGDARISRMHGVIDELNSSGADSTDARRYLQRLETGQAMYVYLRDELLKRLD